MHREEPHIEIVHMTSAHLRAAGRFSERAWIRPRSEAFYRWRYLQAPAQRVLLALSGDECAAMICAFLRDYRLGAERRTCLEPHDWWCLPEFRGFGLGARVIQVLMEGPEPLIGVGGSAVNQPILRRMGWRRATTLTLHRLPLEGSAVTDALRRRFRIPTVAGQAAFALLGRPWFSPRIRARPSGGEACPVSAVGEEISPLYEGETGYRVLPLPNFAHLRWLTQEYPEAGPFGMFHFRVGGELRGWSLLRVHGPEDRRLVTLVEVYAPRPDEALYTWMVSESLIWAAGFRPIAVDTQTACPILRRALHRNRFLETFQAPIHVWPPALPGADEPFHMVHNASDGPLFPYPSDSSSEPAPAGA